MFTGIVEGTGTVATLAAAADGSGARLEVEAPWLAGELRLGESVAVNGCCVTVAEPAAVGFAADLVAETLRRTALGGWPPGDGSTWNAHGPGGRSAATWSRATSTGSPGCWSGPGRRGGGGAVELPADLNAMWSRRGRSRSTGSA